MIATDEPKRNRSYDEDLLVRLVAAGRLSCRQIAAEVGVSAQTVSAVARGVKRADLHERICRTVEAAARRARRRAADSLWELVDKHVTEALAGTGETARKCREFLIRTFLNTPDPAGRFLGRPDGSPAAATPPLPAAGKAAITRGEFDLLAAVRGGATAPLFHALPWSIRQRVRSLVNPAPLAEPVGACDGEAPACCGDCGECDDEEFYQCGLSRDPDALVDELARLRRAAYDRFGAHYFTEDDEYDPAVTEQYRDTAGRQDRWLASRETANNREIAILAMLVRVHRGDEYLDGPDAALDEGDDRAPDTDDARAPDRGASDSAAPDATAPDSTASPAPRMSPEEGRRETLTLLRRLERSNYGRRFPEEPPACEESPPSDAPSAPPVECGEPAPL